MATLLGYLAITLYNLYNMVVSITVQILYGVDSFLVWCAQTWCAQVWCAQVWCAQVCMWCVQYTGVVCTGVVRCGVENLVLYKNFYQGGAVSSDP